MASPPDTDNSVYRDYGLLAPGLLKLRARNRLAELAGWDNELLALELGAMLELDPEFDRALTGFDAAEIEALLNSLDEEATGEAPVEIDEKAPVVSEVGSLWQLGDHRLICGDATDAQVYSRGGWRSAVRDGLHRTSPR